MTTCEATNPDGDVRCAMPAGHGPVLVTEDEQFDHANPSLGVWWSAPPTSDTSWQCGAVKEGDGFVCTLPAGHDRIEVGGALWEHAVFDAMGAALAHWDPVPAVEACDARAARGGWAGDTPPQCELPKGHDGIHAYGPLRWATEACPANVPNAPGGPLSCTREAGHEGRHQDADGSTWQTATRPGWHVLGAPGSWTPLPVRLRLVRLPHVLAPVLVVDRFRDAEHCDAERRMWEAFGERMGALTTFCYPGELDVYSPE